MKAERCVHLYLGSFAVFLSIGCTTAELFTIAGYVSSIAIGWAATKIMPYVWETGVTLFDGCNPIFSSDKFRRLMRSNVFGQPLLENHLLQALNSHYSNKNPSRALSLIFLGSTGTGKNLVSSIIADSIYEKGIQDDNVHLRSGRLHFPLASEVNTYKIELKLFVEKRVKACARSIFIFDEIDKMPHGVIDGIKPFLDHHAVYDGVDYRKATFIFLTNIAGLEINRKYRELRESGLSREDMKYSHFEKLLRTSLFDGSVGMFAQGDVIAGHSIAGYLPFLPLEKSHVVSCITREMKNRDISPTHRNIQEVLGYIDFHLDWSESGCKRVSDFVSLI